MSWGLSGKGKKEAVKKNIEQSLLHGRDSANPKAVAHFDIAKEMILQQIDLVPGDFVMVSAGGHWDASNSSLNISVDQLNLLME